MSSQAAERIFKTLIRPYKVSVERSLDPLRSAEIVLEPLERGFGVTLGSALRRVMLGALPGAAITSVRIDGVLHEFSSLRGIREDVMDILTSLRGVFFKSFSELPQKITLKLTGEQIVTAGMLDVPSGLRVLNPEHVLFSMTDESAAIHLEAMVENGKGYVPASTQEAGAAPIDSLAMDASFSPVRAVSMRVEPSRVGRVTDCDRLILHVETNGSLTPREAFIVASRILQDQLRCIIGLSEEAAPSEEATPFPSLPFSLNFLKRIESLDLTVRARRCVLGLNVSYVGELATISEKDLLRTPNFGNKSLSEIKKTLASLKDETRGFCPLFLGMVVPGWPPEDLDELVQQYTDRLGA